MKQTFRKSLAIILATLMLLTAAPLAGFAGLEMPDFGLTAQAASIEDSGTCGENLTWTLDSDGTLTISGTGDMEDFAETMNSPWNSRQSDVKKIIFEGSVTSISNMAFADCVNLTSITIPGSVKSIGSLAFYRCMSLINIIIPDSVVSIGSSAFAHTGYFNNKDNWRGGVLYIGNCLIVADNISGNYVIKNDTKVIAMYAFSGCDLLTGITIPASVTNVGKIGACEKLVTITVDPKNKKYSSENGVLFNNEKTTLIHYPIGNEQTSYTIPDGVTSIGDSAFYACENLENITVPDSVRSIGNYAFEDCANLVRISFGEKSQLTSIEKGAFCYCLSLADITIPDNVSSIGSEAFYYCQSLKSINLPDGLTMIRDRIFYYCNSLEKISIPDSVISIEELAFAGCKKLVAVNFGEKSNLTSIGNSAFSNCTSLPNISIPSTVTEIGGGAFGMCLKLTSIDIPAGVTKIRGSTFYLCISLEDISLPYNLTSIAATAFVDTAYYNDHDNWIDNVLYIGNYLICANKYISGYYGIKYGTRVIADSAFAQAEDDLSKIYIPDTVINVGQNTFSACKSLKEIIVAPDNAYYCSDEYGVLYDYTKTTLIQYPIGAGISEYVIPSSVVNIEEQAFYDCTSLTTITFEKNSCLENIGSYAFAYCDNLADITLPECSTAINIDSFAFHACDSLESFITPANVTSIGDAAFSYCKNLSSVVFDKNSRLINIGVEAFRDCTSLTQITIPASVKKIGGSALDCPSLMSITVDAENEYYSSDEYGVLFDKSKTILIQYPIGNQRVSYTIPDGVKIIESSAFEYCKCESVIIPSSVNVIYDFAFYYCDNLTSITILNKECEITDHHCTISSETVIYGYTGSTAQAYALKYNRAFVPIDEHVHNYIAEVFEEAQCEKIGTMIYVCECGDKYTETIQSLGHIDKDGNGSCDRCSRILCEHICHKDGILGIFWKIVRFFWKLFGMNPVCECGKAHY